MSGKRIQHGKDKKVKKAKPIRYKKNGKPKMSTARKVAIGATGLGSFILALGIFLYLGLVMGISGINESLLGERPPVDPKAGNSVNILIVGIDNRQGENESISGGGDEINYNTDTNVLIHLSSDRSRADVVSIPRDSMVDIPVCKTTNGNTEARTHAMFNSAFSSAYALDAQIDSGIACTVATIEHNTNIKIDEYGVIDFNGFQTIIDALGGVEICVDEEVYSEKAGNLHITPGCHVLNGHDATEYARARTGTGLGDGSDISRISRQQQLMTSIIKTALNKNIFDLTELYRFAQEGIRVTKTTMSLQDMVGIGLSLKNLSAENINFVTVPWESDPADSNRIVWSDEATTMWDEIRQDQKLTISGVRTAEEINKEHGNGTDMPNSSSSESSSSSASS